MSIESAKTPRELWPSESQLHNQRSAELKHLPRYSADNLGALQDFMANPPTGVKVFESQLECSESRNRIRFASTEAIAHVGELKLPAVLMDFTFKTNKAGLVLGVVGPAGIHAGGLLPSMRFLPTMFMLSDAEDVDARRLLLKIYLEWAAEQGIEISDGFFDCHCLQSAESECGDSVFLHRCLQHTKTNIDTESKKKDDITGLPRLKRGELLPVIKDWVEFSGKYLPSDLEFTTFWSSILDRMESSGSSTDFNEPAMAAYIKKHILVNSGNSIYALWQGGLGAVPLGMTTYAPNCIERTHRTIKELVPGNWRKRNIAELMTGICDVVANRIKVGKYNDMVRSLDAPAVALKEWPSGARMQEAKETQGQDDGKDVKAPALSRASGVLT